MNGKDFFYTMITIIIIGTWNAYFWVPEVLGQRAAQIVKSYNQELTQSVDKE